MIKMQIFAVSSARLEHVKNLMNSLSSVVLSLKCLLQLFLNITRSIIQSPT